jgi:hypothetical protein
MTASDDVLAGTAPPPLPAEAVATRWSRWSDRLNPILVREVQQALKGRVFVMTVCVALVVSVAIAVVVVGRYKERAAAGADAFNAGLALLVPLFLFVLPMQAYQSMRLELRAGIVEQLLLSRLRPTRILLGKLQSAMVQCVLYLALLSPLMATSYLLRGIDLATIVVSLGLALLGCVVATSFAISSAAQGVLPGLQPLANIATAFGLGMASFGFAGFAMSGEFAQWLGMLLRTPWWPAVLSGIVLGAAASATLSLLAARSFLVHAFENKSTAFRVFLFACPVAVFGWMAAFVDRAAWPDFVPVLSLVLLVLGVVFATFMVTEQAELSPRLRAHAPTGVLRGVLAAPFLPGRDRGALCFCLYAALLAGIYASLWGGPTAMFGFAAQILRVAWMGLAYALAWLVFGRWLRARLPAALPGNHLARFLLPATWCTFLLLPVLIDMFVRGDVDGWHLGHVLNPFWTTERFAVRMENWPAAQRVVPWVVAALLAVQVPVFVRGVREVLVAGRARVRSRAAAEP